MKNTGFKDKNGREIFEGDTVLIKKEYFGFLRQDYTAKIVFGTREWLVNGFLGPRGIGPRLSGLHNICEVVKSIK